MNQRNRDARLLTGGLIGALPVTTPGDEHWDDVVLLLDGSSLSDDLSTAQNDVSAYDNTTVANGGAVTLGTTNGTTVPHPYVTTTGVPYLDFHKEDGLEVPSTTFDVSGGDWTFECWVRFATTSQHFDSIFSTASAGGIQLYYNSTNQTLTFDKASGALLTYTSNSVTLGQWHHVALTFDYSANKLTMFIDGKGVSSTNSNWVTDIDAYLDASQHKLVFGVNRSNAGPLDGQLADIRFTKGVIRYTGIFNPPSASLPANAQIVGRRGVGTYDTGDEHWDEVTLLLDGSSLTDELSDAGNDLSVYTNTAVSGSSAVTLGTTNGTTVAHPYGNAGVPYLDFNRDDGLKVPSTFDVSNGDWTFECWVRFETGAVTFDSIFSTAAAPGIQLYYDATAQTLTFDKSGGSILTYTSNSITPDQWHHVALTFDYSVSTVTMYIDGVGVGDTNSNWVTDINAYLDASQHDLVFGVNRDNNNPLNGQLTDIRFTKGVIRYTSSFDPPEASLPPAPVGAPEATATLRTRGYLGAAPAGGGMLTLYDRYLDNLT